MLLSPGTQSVDTSIRRIPRRGLMLARIAWIIIVVPAFALFVANIPAYYAALHHLRAPGPQLITGQLTLVDRHTLQTWGLSLDFYAVCMVGISLLFQVSYTTMGAILFWRRSDDRVALLASFALPMLPFGFASLTLQALPPAWLWLIPTLMTLGNASIMLCAYVFPDGRFMPSWVRWLALFMLAYWATSIFLPFSWSFYQTLYSFILFGLIASTIFVQVYRYRYVSTPQQRQQTKWVVYGIAIAATGNIGARLLRTFVLLPSTHGSALPDALMVILVTCSMLVIPPTLGIAILRSRLWDIDVIIKRTLVYAVLTAALALVYFGSIIILQSLVSVITGQFSLWSQSPLVIVASTLAIAALFQPLRRRIQIIIDRRFYRSRYDAAHTLAAFSATLRNEVDLNQLNEQLVGMIQETMQPEHVTLWLRPHRWEEKKITRLLPRLNEEEAQSE
ncbi:MAG TPA: hypothetical protein VJO32_10915 [Ktedonobacteraceae bacterium]|nr:hypothetical protein [Ktedonobacteraceae bacterium]